MNSKKLFLLIISTLLFQLLIPEEIYGQENQSTFLKKETFQQIIDSIKFSDPENIIIYKEALFNFQEKNIIKAGAFMEIGYFFFEKKEYERCIEYLDTARSFFVSPKDNFYIYQLYMLKGNASLYISKNQEALNAYYKALEINSKINKSGEESEIKEVKAKMAIAIVKRKTNQFKKALEVYKKTLEFINNSKLKNSRTHVTVLDEMSFIYIDTKKYDSVLYYSNKGIQISKSYKYTKELANFYTANGIVFYHKGECEKALKFLFDAEDILLNDNSPEKRYLTNIVYYQARCFFRNKDYRKTIFKIKEILVYIEDSEFNFEIKNLYTLLAESNKAIGNEDEAYYWLEKVIKVNEGIQKEKDETIDLIFKKNNQEYNNRITYLSTLKNKTSFMVLFLVLFLILFFGIFYKKQKQSKKVFKELIEKINSFESEENQTKKNEVKELIINNKKTKDVLRKLEKLEQKQYYLNIDCSLSLTAKKLNTNITYLSKIIHFSKKKKFNNYINDLRIDYTLNRLRNDNTFRLFSIKSIATEVGYKSDSSFTKHFKSKTGVNPSTYIKNLNG